MQYIGEIKKTFVEKCELKAIHRRLKFADPDEWLMPHQRDRFTYKLLRRKLKDILSRVPSVQFSCSKV